MMKYIRLVLVVGMYFLFAAPAIAAVVINEVYPKTADPTYNWIELYNTGSESVSLNLWKVSHTQSDGKEYILNASRVIGPRSFLTLWGTQTGIAFGVDGDTIQLFDQTGARVDAVSYPGVLGYNRSYGRTVDGAGDWVICEPTPPYGPTPNTNNNCPPAPTPTSVPPTPMPTPTATPTPTPFVPTPTVFTFGGLMNTPTPTPTPMPTPTPAPTSGPAEGIIRVALPKSWIGYGLLIVAAGALSAMVALWLKRRR